MSEYIPESFRKEIICHVYKNVIANYTDWSVPLILVISGPPGVGKTYQTEKILEEMSCNVHRMSGSEFESGEAGRPAKLIQKAYLKASQEQNENKRPSVLLIDDADSVIGNWGEMVQYTVNSQMVNKTLLDIADHPKVIHEIKESSSGGVALKKTDTNRISIIMTCNDSGKFYAPLMRPGRSKLFVWNPDLETVKMVVGPKFPYLDADAISELVDRIDAYSKSIDPKRYINGVPISTYTDMGTMLLDRQIVEISHNISLNEIVSNPGDIGSLIADYPNPSVDLLFDLAAELVQRRDSFV